MAKTARKPDSTSEQPMEGTHKARLLGILDLGLAPEWTWNGKTIEEDWKLEFVYELVNHPMLDGRPFVISEEMSNKNSENPKKGTSSTLVSRAKALMGQDYKDGLHDLERLLDNPCMVTIIAKDNGYMKIAGQAGVGSLPFGDVVKELTNSTYYFDMDTPDMDKWESFPDFKKEKFQKAVNFNETELARELANSGEY